MCFEHNPHNISKYWDFQTLTLWYHLFLRMIFDKISHSFPFTPLLKVISPVLLILSDAIDYKDLPPCHSGDDGQGRWAHHRDPLRCVPMVFTSIGPSYWLLCSICFSSTFLFSFFCLFFAHPDLLPIPFQMHSSVTVLCFGFSAGLDAKYARIRGGGEQQHLLSLDERIVSIQCF